MEYKLKYYVTTHNIIIRMIFRVIDQQGLYDITIDLGDITRPEMTSDTLNNYKIWPVVVNGIVEKAKVIPSHLMAYPKYCNDQQGFYTPTLSIDQLRTWEDNGVVTLLAF